MPDKLADCRVHGLDSELLIVEGGLFLAGVPNGGLDIDPFEANTALQVNIPTRERPSPPGLILNWRSNRPGQSCKACPDLHRSSQSSSK